MYIKSVSPCIVDIFLNHGWTSWIRIERVMNKGTIIIRQIGGTVALTPDLSNVLKNKIRWG